MRIRVLIVDDHEDFRLIFSVLIGSDPDLEAIGEAEDGEAAVALACGERPDLVLLDVMIPVLNGFEVTRRIKRERPDTKVLLVSSLTDDVSRHEADRCGADGFLNKRDVYTLLLPMIRNIAGVNDGTVPAGQILRTTPREQSLPKPSPPLSDVLPVTGGTGEFRHARGELEVKFAPVFTDPATLTFKLK